jgi:hypothetical protein
MEGTTHSTICKFNSADNHLYTRLAKRIRIGQSGVRKHDERIGELRKWIKEDNDMNQSDHDNHVDLVHEGTCKWLFRHPVFQQWIAKKDTVSTLWVTGPSGVGKTVLCSATIDYVSELPEKPGVAFLFLNFDLPRSRIEMLRMIASKLLDRVVECDLVPEQAFWPLKYSNKDYKRLEDLIRTLLGSSSHAGYVFIFVDGLNEIASKIQLDKPEDRKMAEKEENDAKKVVKFLFECSADQPNLRLWFSSQADDRTSEWMASEKATKLEIPEKDSSTDVQSYIRSKLDQIQKLEIPKNLSSIGDIESYIRSTLNEKSKILQMFTELMIRAEAGNNFRWAAMMIETISKCSNDNEVKATLERGLTQDLSDLYSISLRRLQNLDMSDLREPGRIGYSRQAGVHSLLTEASG